MLQQTPEWLEMRKTKVGASDAPVIMQVSPWTTPYQLWQQKLGLAENKSNFAMQRGLEMESKARDAFEQMTGIMIQPKVKMHKDLDWMMASLDGIDIEEKHVVEIKCPGSEDHAIAQSGNIPDKYFPQVQHQMEVCGLEEAYYFSFTADSHVLVKSYRDDKYIKKMLSKEKEFFECMQELTAPDLCERDYVNKTNDRWIQKAEQLLKIREQQKSLEVQEKEIQEDLILMAGNQNAMGGGIKLSKCLRKGAVQYGKIPELKQIDLEKYRKEPIEYWKIISA